VGAGASAWLHLRAGFRFPFAWPDEAHFLTPALNLAERGTLAAPQLNAPEGMFWMPDGFAALYGAVFTVAPDTLFTARMVSFAAILVCAGLMYAAATRLGAARLPTAGLVALWAVSPGVVIAGNVARMEALLLALLGAVVYAAAAERWPLALALAAGSMLVHPIGAVVFLAAAISAATHRGHVRLRPTGAEWGMAALVAMAFVAEAIRFGAHLSIVVDHLTFQLERKASRSPTPGAVATQAVVVGVAEAVLSVWARRWLGAHRAAVVTTLSLLVGGFAVVFAVGQEMWYAFLRSEGAVLLAGLAMLITASTVKAKTSQPRGQRRRRAAVGVTTLSVLVALATLGTTQARSLGFSMADAPRGEWDTFVETTVARLRRLDARLQQPALVGVDRASAIGYPLRQREWQHLRFVTPTPVSRLDEANTDFVAYSIVPKLDTRADLYRLMPEKGATVSVVSASGAFELQLHRPREAAARRIPG
jgi:hypothetical protein